MVSKFLFNLPGKLLIPAALVPSIPQHLHLGLASSSPNVNVWWIVHLYYKGQVPSQVYSFQIFTSSMVYDNTIALLSHHTCTDRPLHCDPCCTAAIEKGSSFWTVMCRDEALVFHFKRTFHSSVQLLYLRASLFSWLSGGPTRLQGLMVAGIACRCTDSNKNALFHGSASAAVLSDIYSSFGSMARPSRARTL